MTRKYRKDWDKYGFDPEDLVDEIAAIPQAIMNAFGLKGQFAHARSGREDDSTSTGFDWDYKRGSGARRRRRRMFDNGELRLVLLKLIADEPRHGYDLIRAMEDMTEGDYAPSPGVIYPTLNLLEDSGLIAPQESDGSRKIFAVTDEGLKEVDKEADIIAVLLERLDRRGGRQRARAKKAGSPVGRATGNLMSALGNRVMQSDTNDETRHAIAGILDEAARKIERL